MIQNSDEEMEDLMNKILYDSAYKRKGKNIGHRKLPLDPKRQRKFLLLGSAAIFLLVAIIAIYFRAGNRHSPDALTSIHSRIDRLDKKLKRIEMMENRIVLLKKQGGGLRHSISELDRSGKSLREQLDKMTKEIEWLKKRMSPADAKTETTHAVQGKPISKVERRYHKVHRGDTLYRIAKKYGISMDELSRLNNLTQNQIIYPGQKILVSPDQHKRAPSN
jgi:LysM repeat protein